MRENEMLMRWKSVDWSKAQVQLSRYSAGHIDWWQFSEVQNDRRVMVIGEDTDGDSVVDFIHADTTGSGRIDFSAFFHDDCWQFTNLVEAWLEVNFSLPWARSAYVPYNVDIFAYF